VGCEAELTQLHRWLEKALAGERQLVFVTGEPGIGKTTLLEVFLHRLASRVQGLESLGQKENQKAKRGAKDWGLGAILLAGRNCGFRDARQVLC